MCPAFNHLQCPCCTSPTAGPQYGNNPRCLGQRLVGPVQFISAFSALQGIAGKIDKDEKEMMATARRREENKQEMAEAHEQLLKIAYFLRLQKWLENSAVRLLAFIFVLHTREVWILSPGKYWLCKLFDMMLFQRTGNHKHILWRCNYWVH